MANSPTPLAVVAGALAGESGRWLMQRRPLHKHHGGLWEFPGGKVESGESPRNALARELNEELGIRARPSSMRFVGSAQSCATPDAPAIVLQLYICRSWTGIPQAEEGARIGWFTMGEVGLLDLAPLDVELAGALAAEVSKGLPSL